MCEHLCVLFAQDGTLFTSTVRGRLMGRKKALGNVVVVGDLVRLCEPARQAAAVLEKNPHRVPLPGNPDPDALLSIRELMKILPFPPEQAAIRGFLYKTLGLEPVKRARLHGEHNPSCLYRVRDIERALLKRRGALEVLRLSGGRAQMLSASLCVTFHNQLYSSRSTLTFLPELVNAGVLSGLLGHRQKNTVFSRHGFQQRNGSPMRIHTHAFRHWLNTLADQGGLSDVELARWMGRRDIRQNQAYKHGTVEQRVAWAQEMLVTGKLLGATASVEKIAPSLEDVFVSLIEACDRADQPQQEVHK